MEVRPVKTRRDWRAFFRIRRQINGNDPTYIRPLNSQERLQLDVDRHPFYKHAQREAFICWDKGKPVGRIVAIIDHLHQEYYSDKTGFFGFFESVNDSQVAKSLIDTCQDWLHEKGCDLMRGPVNPSMKAEFGILTVGHQYPPYIMMAQTPKYYATLLSELGFKVARRFYCLAVLSQEHKAEYQENWDRIKAIGKRATQRHPEFRVFNPTRNQLDRELRRINELGNRVRAENWGFVPLTDDELDHTVKQIKLVIRPEHIILVESGDKLVGFLVGIPDVNWALKKSKGPFDWIRLPQLLYWVRRTPRARVLMMGVDPAYRHKGVTAIFLGRVLDINSHSFGEWEFSWVDETNVKSLRPIQRVTKLDVYKKYALYERAIRL